MSSARIQLQKELDEMLAKISAVSSQLTQEKQQHEAEKKKSKEKDDKLQQKENLLQQEKQHHEAEKKKSREKDDQLQQKENLLQQEKQKSKEKDDQIQRKDERLLILQKEAQQLKEQLANHNQVGVSPFVADKPYQIDLAKNGVTAPSNPNAFGSILSAVLQTSPLFLEAKRLFRVGGSSFPSICGVANFTLEKVEVIFSDIATLEGRMRRLQQLRTQAGNLFNPVTGSFSAEQLQLLISLRDSFLPRSPSADPKTPNLINVFHGTRVDRLKSVANGLVAVRSTDAGYFGSGCYTTTSIEYAAKYASGEFDTTSSGPYPKNADGCYPVVWCVAAVGVCYPLTREVDYSKKRVHDGMQVSDFFGMPLQRGYDCHCVAVNESAGFQAVARDKMQYMEIVFDQEVQILPIAVLWVK